MDKSKIMNMPFFNGIIKLLKWIGRFVFIIIVALMIGFANAFNDELKWINNPKNFDEQEQVIDDEDTNEY